MNEARPTPWGNEEKIETFTNGFTATLGGMPQETIRDKASERKRVARLRSLSWSIGACTPEKNFRIVERRVNWHPQARSENGFGPLVASMTYVGLCIRDRGCIPPAERAIRAMIVEEAILQRRKGQSYYEGCRWLADDIRKLERDAN